MAENEKQEGLQMENLEALAGEFTLDDLAEFDNGLEFDVTDLESIKPVYTTKEKLKLILMGNKVFSIIKWSIAGLGVIGLVLYILSQVSQDISESLTKTVSKAVRGALTVVSNLLPFSFLEILALLVLAGLLGYAGFLVYKTIKEKDGYKIAGIWVQYGYVLLAVFGCGFLIYTMCYGVTTNRVRLYNSYLKDDYYPSLPLEETLDSSMIYYSDQLNQVAVEGLSSIYYTTTGSSRYASTGSSVKEISEAVNACFDQAAEDYPFLKGGKVTAKKLLFSPLYTAMGIGSIYSPLTSEVLINTDYPEVAIPMQVGRAIAKQRGITNDGDASFVAFLACSKYASALADSGATYNMDFIKYAAYFDAYLEVGNIVFQLGADTHLYCGSALKETVKKDVVAYTKSVDTLYGNIANLEFVSATEKTSTNTYKVLAKLLYMDFQTKSDNGDVSFMYNDKENPVPIKSSHYSYTRYLVAYFNQDLSGDWGTEVDTVYGEYNPKPLDNDGTGASTATSGTSSTSVA